MSYLKKKFAHLFPKQHLTIFFLLLLLIMTSSIMILSCFMIHHLLPFLILLKLLLRYLIPLYQILPLLRNLISLIQILMVMFMLRLSCGFRWSCSWHFHTYCCSWWFLVCYRFYWQCNSIPSEISPPIPSKNNPYLNFQRERECKSCNLERIIRAISSPQKNETQSNCSYTEDDSQDNQYETTICNAVI